MEVSPPLIQINIHGFVFPQRIKLIDNVKAIKGNALVRLMPALKKKLKPDRECKVSLNKRALKNGENVGTMDFVNHEFIVEFPDLTADVVDNFVRTFLRLEELLLYC